MTYSIADNANWSWVHPTNGPAWKRGWTILERWIDLVGARPA